MTFCGSQFSAVSVRPVSRVIARSSRMEAAAGVPLRWGAPHVAGWIRPTRSGRKPYRSGELPACRIARRTGRYHRQIRPDHSLLVYENHAGPTHRRDKVVGVSHGWLGDGRSKILEVRHPGGVGKCRYIYEVVSAVHRDHPAVRLRTARAAGRRHRQTALSAPGAGQRRVCRRANNATLLTLSEVIHLVDSPQRPCPTHIRVGWLARAAGARGRKRSPMNAVRRRTTDTMRELFD